MSSIYRSQWEKEAREELKYLYEKKGRYGWTKSDAERAQMLEKELDKS